MKESLLIPERYRARLFSVNLDMDVFIPMRIRLEEKAEADMNKSWGIFPGLKHTNNKGMPECWRFVDRHRTIGQQALVSFILMNKVPQECLEGPVHFDLDEKSGITHSGSGLITTDEIWRKSVNLSDKPSSMIQSLQLPSTMRLENNAGSLKAVEYDETLLERIIVPGRDGNIFYGVEFCGSHIGHGADHSTWEDERFGGVWSYKVAA